MSIARINIGAVEKSLSDVETYWQDIQNDLEKYKIGRKDTFDTQLKNNMLDCYSYFDDLLKQGIEPFSEQSIEHMIELNNIVHYGLNNNKLRMEYSSALQATRDKFYSQIGPIRKWHEKHQNDDGTLKIAAEIYVAIVGKPQVFIEGNHRTGSLIANWMNLYHGYSPFVLSPENAIAYFAPSAEIKFFADKTTWRGRRKLPKYRKSFKKLWEKLIDEKYVKK